jgi:hypothetical protein
MGIEVDDPREHSKDCGDDTTIVLAMVVAFALFLFLSGCSAKVGPDEYGWARWDVCGFEGGVAAELTILAMTARLGCTNPPLGMVEEDPELELEVTP